MYTFKVHYLVHPSPRNIKYADEKWISEAKGALEEAGLLAYFPCRRSGESVEVVTSKANLPDVGERRRIIIM
jgi:hypothetical protein